MEKTPISSSSSSAESASRHQHAVVWGEPCEAVLGSVVFGNSLLLLFISFFFREGEEAVCLCFVSPPFDSRSSTGRPKVRINVVWGATCGVSGMIHVFSNVVPQEWYFFGCFLRNHHFHSAFQGFELFSIVWGIAGLGCSLRNDRAYENLRRRSTPKPWLQILKWLHFPKRPFLQTPMFWSILQSQNFPSLSSYSYSCGKTMTTSMFPWGVRQYTTSMLQGRTHPDTAPYFSTMFS